MRTSCIGRRDVIILLFASADANFLLRQTFSVTQSIIQFRTNLQSFRSHFPSFVSVDWSDKYALVKNTAKNWRRRTHFGAVIANQFNHVWDCAQSAYLVCRLLHYEYCSSKPAGITDLIMLLRAGLMCSSKFKRPYNNSPRIEMVRYGRAQGHCLHENCPSTDNGVAHYVFDLPESEAGTICGFVRETPSTFSLQNSLSQESYHFKIRRPISLIYFGRELVYPA